MRDKNKVMGHHRMPLYNTHYSCVLTLVMCSSMLWYVPATNCSWRSKCPTKEYAALFRLHSLDFGRKDRSQARLSLSWRCLSEQRTHTILAKYCCWAGFWWIAGSATALILNCTSVYKSWICNSQFAAGYLLCISLSLCLYVYYFWKCILYFLYFVFFQV